MNKLTRTILIFIIAAALVVFTATLVRALWWAPEISALAPATSTAQRIVPPEEQAAKLIVPKLGIEADIQYVGVNAKGNMGVPSNFTDVAWYKFGTVPGERGSAAIAGHVDNGLGLAGVFKDLDNLEVGDDVYVVKKNGERLHFVVQEAATYHYQEVPLEKVFNRDDGAYLNLITCDGSWIKTAKTYEERLVVYTKLVR